MKLPRAVDVPTMIRLVLAFLSVSAITAALGCVANVRIGRINGDLHGLFNRHLLGSVALGAANTAEVRAALNGRAAWRTTNPVERDAARARSVAFMKESDTRFAEYRGLVSEAEQPEV